MTLGDFVREHKGLFWSTKNYDALNEAVVVETILNYGDMNNFAELVSLIGIKKMAEIFWKQIQWPRNNYRPEVKNYFSLYFKRYA